MEAVLDAASWTCLVLGAAFSVIGGIGLLRLPDLFARMHGSGITDTMGAGLILAGLMFQSGLDLATAKLVLILFFLFITSPTSAHALARSALSHGLKPRLATKEARPSDR